MSRFVSALFLVSLLLPGSLQALPEDPTVWTLIDSAHFEIYTDAGAERGVEIAQGLEQFWAVFARLAPQLELSSPAPTKIFAFRDRQSFGPYKSRADGGGAFLLGQFLAHADGNYLTLDAGTRLVGSLTVVQHELVHYLVRHNFPEAPLWFNEGLAEYYSTFVVEGEVARVGSPIERHLGWLERRGVDLSSVLEANRRSAAYHEPGQVGGFYAGSWALVHYLLSGSTERLLQVADFFLELDEGVDPQVAFERSFDLRISTLEKELADYLRTELPTAEIPVEEIAAEGTPGVRRAAPADVLFHLGDLLLHMGRVRGAEEHFHTALGHDPEHGASYGGLALARDFERRFEEAAVLYGDALEKGSTEPVTYLALGRHLLSRVQVGADPELGAEKLAAAMERRAAEARQALALALELYPQYGEATVLLGLSHRLPGGDPEEGVRLLGRARELLPQRRELVVEQVRQLGMLGERIRGEALIEGALMTRGRYELAEEARDALERESLLFEARQALAEEDYETAIERFDLAIAATRDPAAVERMEEQLERMQELLGDG